MGRNEKDSKWYSTPRALRKRKGLSLTLPPETLAFLDVLATRYGSRSAAIERLVRAEQNRYRAQLEDDHEG